MVQIYPNIIRPPILAGDGASVPGAADSEPQCIHQQFRKIMQNYAKLFKTSQNKQVMKNLKIGIVALVRGYNNFESYDQLIQRNKYLYENVKLKLCIDFAIKIYKSEPQTIFYGKKNIGRLRDKY